MKNIRSEDIFQPPSVRVDFDWEIWKNDCRLFDYLIEKKVVEVESIELNPKSRLIEVDPIELNDREDYLHCLDIHHDKALGLKIALFMYKKHGELNFAKTEREIEERERSGEPFYCIVGTRRYFEFYSDMTLVKWNGGEYDNVVPVELGSTGPHKVVEAFGLTLDSLNETSIKEFWIAYKYLRTPIQLFILKRGKNWSKIKEILQEFDDQTK